MASAFAAALAKMRHVVHSTFCLDANHTDPMGSVVTSLRVRWHSDMAMTGDLANEGYANVLNSVNAITFDRQELAEKGIALRRQDRITIVEPGWGSVILCLTDKHESDGPVEEVWGVVRL